MSVVVFFNFHLQRIFYFKGFVPSFITLFSCCCCYK